MPPTNRSASRPDVAAGEKYTCWLEETPGTDCGKEVPEGSLPWVAVNSPRKGNSYLLCAEHRRALYAALEPFASAIFETGPLGDKANPNPKLNRIAGNEILIPDADLRAALVEMGRPIAKSGPLPDEEKLAVVEDRWGAEERAHTEILWQEQEATRKRSRVKRLWKRQVSQE